MRALAVGASLRAILCLLAPAVSAQTLVIVGASGEERFSESFANAAKSWIQASAASKTDCLVVGLEESDTSDFERIRQWIEGVDPESIDPLWIVYIGHGTFDRKQALLNLTGPDLDVEDMKRWLEPIKRELVFVHGGSASVPFLTALSKPGRILISATRSADEINYARFGERFAQAIANQDADIDHDGQVSVLEAFLAASDSAQRFYKEAGRMSSEHALIDDNGDKKGTPYDWFEAGRLVKAATGTALPDGSRARQFAYIPSKQEAELTPDQRARRDEIERSIEELRRRKSSLVEGEYYQLLEPLLLRIAAIYNEPPES